MRSLAAAGTAALALLVLVVAFGGVGGAAQDEAPAETLRVELQPDGDANWTVTMRLDLDSANGTEGFDRLATEFEAGESDVLNVDPYREAADRAEAATGRTMEIRNVTRRASRANETGSLHLSFTWEAFARQSDDRLLLGDVFQTETGTWLPGLDERQALIVEFPDGFDVVDTSHNIENRSFEIHGPATFEPGMPSATLVSGRTSPTVTTDDPNGTAAPPERSDWEMIGLGALAVLIGTLALLVERRRRSDEGADPIGSVDGGGPDAPGATDGAGAGVESELGADADGASGEPLLSDDERILRLLHRNDGRMKQARIVEETDWSNAKVSQLLSEMSESGQVDKLRIGRENLISLPGEGPDEDG